MTLWLRFDRWRWRWRAERGRRLAREATGRVEASLAHATSTDRLYLDLKGARERLCRAQVAPRSGGAERGLLDQAVMLIDIVGGRLCPEQWSGRDRMEAP